MSASSSTTRPSPRSTPRVFVGRNRSPAASNGSRLDRLQRSLKRADAVLFLVDATEKISHVDNHRQDGDRRGRARGDRDQQVGLAEGEIGRRGRPVGTADYDYLRKGCVELSFARSRSSAAGAERARGDRSGGRGWPSRAGCGSPRANNRMIEKLLAERGPTNKLGDVAKIYAAQTARRPPSPSSSTSPISSRPCTSGSS